MCVGTTFIPENANMIGKQTMHFFNVLLFLEFNFTEIKDMFSSVSATHAVGRRFTPWPGHTKDHHKNGINCLPACYARVKVGV